LKKVIRLSSNPPETDKTHAKVSINPNMTEVSGKIGLQALFRILTKRRKIWQL